MPAIMLGGVELMGGVEPADEVVLARIVPTRTSAAVLAFRETAEGELSVFLGHMGGPFWAGRDAGAWSIPKGEYRSGEEDPAEAARREFEEEIGRPAPAGPWHDLGEFRQPSGKLIRAFAVAAGEELAFVRSNEFPLEWPRGSGRVRMFPEIDRAQWFPLQVAQTKVVPGQRPILLALTATLRR